MWWILYAYYVIVLCGGQNSGFCKVSLRICYISLNVKVLECCYKLINCYKLPCVEQGITKLD